MRGGPYRSRTGSSARHCPGGSVPSAYGPIDTRISRSVGCPTAAVMRRTCRLRPSRIPISIHDVGIAARYRIGGSRGQSRGGASMSRARAGRVRPSFRTTPARSFSIAASAGTPSTCAQ